MPILEPMARSADIAIVDEVSNDLPDLHADGRALKKVVVNLVINAIKNSRPKGTVRISAETTGGRELVLRIEDDGVGMNPGVVVALMADRLSDEGAGETSRSLGLFVVKKLLAMHQATLHIETRENKGTTVTFPADRVLAPSVPRGSALPAAAAAG